MRAGAGVRASTLSPGGAPGYRLAMRGRRPPTASGLPLFPCPTCQPQPPRVLSARFPFSGCPRPLDRHGTAPCISKHRLPAVTR